MEKQATRAGPGWRVFGLESAAVLLAFLGVALTLYEPVMEGEFISDDMLVIVTNPYVHDVTLDKVVAIFDPHGPPIGYAMNYSPVPLLVHAAEVELFGSSMRGYHTVNAALHAVTAWLLMLLLISSRLPATVAAASALFYLVHPANVEAVAMVFQLKTTLAAALAFGALLAFWRHPLPATLLFGLAVLTKFSALFALPTALVLAWTRSADPERPVPHWGWLVAWAMILLAVAIPEFDAFRRTGQGIELDWIVQGRTIVAISMRYLVNAATSFGVAAFQQPAPVSSWGNPWFLTGVVALGLLVWRAGWALLRRQEEAAWWVMAAASFAPVSQVFSFIYPVADRYLYTILPGLLGGALLACREPAARAEAWLRGRLGSRASGFPMAQLTAVALLLAMSVVLAPRAYAHTRVFLNGGTVSQNSAENYPDGVQAWMFKAIAYAQQRDAAGTAAALREIHRQGFYLFQMLTPMLGPVYSDPRVKEALAPMARQVVERNQAIENPFQSELVGLAIAQFELDQLPAAIESLERAARLGGPREAEVWKLLQDAQKELARRQAGAAEDEPGRPQSSLGSM